MTCDPNKQPSGHGRPTEQEGYEAMRRLHDAAQESPIDRLILDADGTQCTVCKGGRIVATESDAGDAVNTKCQRCGNEGRIELR